MVDYASAIPMYVPADNVFLDQNIPLWVVIHKTAGFKSAQDVANFFATVPDKRSVHYIVGQDGAVVQCVDERHGAGGNCCLETGHDSFWPTNINLNWVTISVEHVDPALDNSTPVTPAQKHASFLLVADICRRHGIAASRIAGHNSIAQVPVGWTDDGTTLTAPNGITVIQGFRARILQGWDPANLPLEKERNVDTVEQANPSIGAGSIQTFTNTRLGWTATKVVYVIPIGSELLLAENKLPTSDQSDPSPVP
jgi:hypothetical protein